jgi:UDP-N-acetylmuramyl pentapeptide phosphotransferase/UDP-N-acetylglucosamine-1-phosphate transferase
MPASRSRGLLYALAGTAIGAVAARAAYAAFTRNRTHDLSGRWTRKNHRGEPITLLEGPAFVAGSSAAAALAPGLPGRLRLAALVAGVGSGTLGAYDDLYGTTSSKGFKGHLTALARGEVTSGAVKILGIGATGLGAAALVSQGPVETLVNGATIAGAANLANLFDLRPGRAVKVGLLTGAPLLAAALFRGSPAAAALAAVPLGAAAALMPEDLGERAMLGDAGANSLGALLGLAAVTQLGRPGRYAVLGTVVALTAAAEKVSFTKVIAGNRVLNRLDMLGRRPVDPA